MKGPVISLQVLFLVLFDGFDTTVGGNLKQGTGAVNFPKGYSVRPGDNAAYKFYTDKKSWADARDRCVSDGGHLAILDTPEKVAHVRKIIGKGDNWVFIGFHRSNDTRQWIRVDNDSSVTSIPWEEDVVKKMPYRSFKCSMLAPAFTGLLKWNCDSKDKSICEIPIIANQTKQPKINASSLKVTAKLLLGKINQASSPKTLPKGYSIYPGDNAAYKFYTDKKTWANARDRCVSDGGHLAIVDTPEKVAHVRRIIGKGDNWVYVGIHRSDNTGQWIRVDSGSSLTSIPWEARFAGTLPFDDFKCAMVFTTINGLMKWNCDWKEPSLCEIPIISNQAVTKTKQQPTTAMTPKRKKSPKTTTQAPSSLTLPEGYLIYPGYHAGYKLYTDRKPWGEARDRCISDGGRLAIVDKPDKIEHLQNIIKHLNLHQYYMQSHGAKVSPEESIWAFIGLHKLAGSQKWIKVDNGLPVTSVPYFAINPRSLGGDDIKCGLLPPSDSIISAWDCETSEKSLCEIPLSKKQIMNWIKLQETQNTKDNGYTIYPTYNAAYKLYTDRKTWDEARERCISDGGHLAIVDTTDKARHIRNIMNYLYLHKAYVQTNKYKKSPKQHVWAFIGIHKRARAQEWTRVDNELQVRSVPWLNTKPTKQLESTNKCGMLRSYEDGLVRWKCAWKENSLCEKPIAEPDTADETEFQTTFAPPKKGKVKKSVTILLDADDELPSPPGSPTKNEDEVEYVPNRGSFVNFVDPKKTAKLNQIGKKSRTTMKTPAINPRFAVQYPEIQHLGITYKIHEQYLTHDESRKKCVALGGCLAVIDSLDKKNVISSMLEVGSVHVEIVPNSSNFNEWGQLYNGVPQSILSLVSNNRRSISCPALNYDRSELEDTLCSNRLQFVCETPVNRG